MNKTPSPENIPVLEDVVSFGQEPPEGAVLNAAQLAHLEQMIQTAIASAMQQSTQDLTKHLERHLPQILKELANKA
ncbi:MAG: hypothetical protein RIS84_743 [Pseudomonadota bacterium]|jgi:hypothetical protein